MSGFWFLFPQQSLSQALLALGYEAHEVAMVSEMHLVRFLKKHWLSSGELKFSAAGEMSREVSSRHGYFTVGGAQWVFCILKRKKI